VGQRRLEKGHRKCSSTWEMHQFTY
jgi:hypothetical protein